MQESRPPTIQEPRPLTPDEIRFFRFNGFLKLPWRLPAELVEAIKKQARDDIEQAVEPLVRDYRGDVMRLSAIWERGGAIREALGGAEVVPALQSLLGPDVEYMLNRHNHLTLRRQDDRTAMSIELHRDVSNWSRTICTILFYLEDTNLENGCTQIIPGSHLLPNVAPGRKAEDDPWWIASGLLEQRLSIPMPAVGLLAIDSMLLHAAGRNRTAGTRMTLTGGYHVVDHHAGDWDPKRVVVCGERVYRGNDSRNPRRAEREPSAGAAND
jgi:ectoine hydroxylase-related dioxygenase (phytanoyl-CoA dioxygenase family)